MQTFILIKLSINYQYNQINRMVRNHKIMKDMQLVDDDTLQQRTSPDQTENKQK